MDTMTPEQRRRCMSRIRSKDTAPEWRVRRMVHAMGFRYRLHVKHLPGRPDIVLPRHRKIILVHGCFWHAHGCAAARRMPSTRAHFWKQKLARNAARDRAVLRQLWQAGLRVLVVWECETHDAAQLRAILADFLSPTPGGANPTLAYQHALYGLVAETPEEYL